MKKIEKRMGKGKTKYCYKRMLKLVNKNKCSILFITGRTFVNAHHSFQDFVRFTKENNKSCGIAMIDFSKGVVRFVNGGSIQFIGMEWYFKNHSYYHSFVKVIDNLDLVFPNIDTVTLTKR